MVVMMMMMIMAMEKEKKKKMKMMVIVGKVRYSGLAWERSGEVFSSEDCYLSLS